MDNNHIGFGTCDGTGAAINVCLGFTPRYVKVINAEDAGSKLPALEWMKGMAVISALDEGIKTVGISDTDIDRTVMTSSGISAYAGGEVLQYDGETDDQWEYDDDDDGTIDTDASEVFVDGHYERNASTDAAYRCYGDAVDDNPRDGMKVTTTPGFTIGADADVNADGEQLLFMFIR